MKKIIKVLVYIVLSISIFACSKDKTNNNKLVVAMELQYPPFEMIDNDGKPTGISVDIANSLGKYLNREVVIKNTSWTGLIPSLQTGKADIIISSMTITDERSKVIDFSVPYIRAGLSLLISKKSKVDNFNDLNKKGIVVAVKSGTTGAKIAKEQLTNSTVRLFDEVATAVLEVSQGKADAFIYDALTVYKNNQRNPDTTRINIESIPGTDGYWGMGIKKGNNELLNQVNNFIQENQKNGAFDKLGNKYLGDIKVLFDDAGIPFFFDI